MRPYLPPLLAGALARSDTGIDFDGTDFSFLESTGFLAAVLAIGVIAYLAERSEANRRSIELFSGAVGMVLGAMLFAGALADGGSASWPGLIGGVLCAALGWRAVGGLVERAPSRASTAGAAALLTAYADGAALLLAAIAIFVPPASILALVAFLGAAARRPQARG